MTTKSERRTSVSSSTACPGSSGVDSQKDYESGLNSKITLGTKESFSQIAVEEALTTFQVELKF